VETRREFPHIAETFGAQLRANCGRACGFGGQRTNVCSKILQMLVLSELLLFVSELFH
jgi:hypothetical protein